MDNSIDANKKTIELIYGGNEFTFKSEERLIEKANDLGLTDAKITIKQGLKIKDYESMMKRNDSNDNKYNEYDDSSVTPLDLNNCEDDLYKNGY